MNDLTELREITKETVVLCVDDDDAILRVLELELKDFFKEVVLAGNGREGLEKLKSGRVDLVIVDHFMPVMTGLEMIKEIRATGSKVPVVLVTGYPDLEVLAEAINAGVTQFISKPMELDSLAAAIYTSFHRVVIDDLKSAKEKLELLKYRESYYALQQKMALRKQQNFIRDDLYYKKLELTGKDGGNVVYLVNIKYQPMDILSGDLYAVRRISKDKVLVHITDAAGKGLQACITTSIASSFVNHIIEKGTAGNNFVFNTFIHDYMDFTKKQLLDDEAICSLFVLLDFGENVMDIANFSMPPVLIHGEDDNIIVAKPNNLPLMNFSDSVAIDKFEITGIRKLLLCSDGFYSPDYRRYIEEDFRVSSFKNSLYDHFIDRVTAPDDDVTLFFLRKFDIRATWSKEFMVKARMSEVAGLSAEIEGFLAFYEIDAFFVSEFVAALSELLMNAYEHGSLGIGARSKQRLLKEGLYEERLAEIETEVDKEIVTVISSFQENAMQFLMATVTDEGEGFDTSIIKETVRDIELFHYRGLKIVKGLVDEIYYNERGNEVMFFKKCQL